MSSTPQADRWRPAGLATPAQRAKTHDAARAEPSGLERFWSERGQPLFHQQCWCWGWDIRRPAGNLLIERGFRRRRPPDPNAGSSAYRLRGRGYRMGLWGFGIHYSRTGAGGVFVGRYASVPLRTALEDPPDDAWSPDQLPPLGSVVGDRLAPHVLLPRALRWIAAYERWVVRVAGPRHRADAVKEWGDKAVVAAEGMPVAWLDLARAVERTADGRRHESG